MEYEALAYGYIRVDPYSEEGVSRRLVNRQALLALPEMEAGAMLCREMFALPAEFPPGGELPVRGDPFRNNVSRC